MISLSYFVNFFHLLVTVDQDEEKKLYLDVDKQNLGKIMWYYLSSGKYPFVKSDYQPGFRIVKSQPRKIDLKCPVAADVIHKLLYANSRYDPSKTVTFFNTKDFVC